MAENKRKTPHQIILTGSDGTKYTLEFNRTAVERMQRNGFVLDTDRLYMSAKDLIMGAFHKNHRFMDWDKVEPVWLAQNKRGELLKVLAEMYMEPTLTLMGTDDEGEKDENPTWETVE